MGSYFSLIVLDFEYKDNKFSPKTNKNHKKYQLLANFQAFFVSLRKNRSL